MRIFINGLQSVQWMVFLLANIIAVPIAVGAAYDLSAVEISTFIQRMMLITGVITLLQIWIGHRLPLLEGGAGMWWALFLVMAAMAAPGDKLTALQQLEAGMIAAGGVLIVLSLLPSVMRIVDLFTPIVTGVFLILLCVQMSGSFFKGMLGVSRYGHIDWSVAGMSLAVIVIVLLLSLKGKGILRSMGPLLGILAGWGLAAWLGLTEGVETADERIFALPEIMPWGPPVWDFGVLLTSVLTGVILISNLVASVVVMSKTLGVEPEPRAFSRGLRMNGVGSVVSGGFSIVGLVPLSVSAGFIMTTGIREKLPFIIGTALVAVAGFFPATGAFFATLPSEVAYASLFIPFSQMMGFGFRDLMGVAPSNRNLLVIGLSIMFGAGIMFLPPDALAQAAPWLRNVIANGLLMGLLLCMLLEHVIFREKNMEQKETTRG